MKISNAEFKEKCWRDLDKMTFRSKLLRVLSLPITKVLLYFPVTPNQVSLFNILLNFLRLWLFATGNAVNILIGALLLIFSEVLDRVDGGIARCKNIKSMRGSFFDDSFHDFLFLTTFIGIGIGVFVNTGNLIYLYSGFIVGILFVLAQNLFAHRKNILYKKSSDPKKYIYRKLFPKRGLIDHIKQVIYSIFLYLTYILVVMAVLNLWFNILHYYILFYAAYSIFYFCVNFYYLSSFKEDKREN